ncbi:unnamed protein product, partial [Phaeothamnion confervicola]
MPLLTTGNGKIGKPALPEEVVFYEGVLPRFPQLRRWVPNYEGCVDLEIAPRSGAGSGGGGGGGGAGDAEGGAASGGGSSGGGAFMRKLWRKFLGRYSQELSAQWDGRVRFIMLEDLTHPFRAGYPCILDIKMGTRQHRTGATPEKVARQNMKCRSSTSAALGLRLNGMQVWQRATGQYLINDKYWGRTVQADTIAESFKQFFCDGPRLRRGVIRRLLALLRDLADVITRTPCKFYSSSLLLIYDGVGP